MGRKAEGAFLDEKSSSERSIGCIKCALIWQKKCVCVERVSTRLFDTLFCLSGYPEGISGGANGKKPNVESGAILVFQKRGTNNLSQSYVY